MSVPHASGIVILYVVRLQLYVGFAGCQPGTITIFVYGMPGELKTTKTLPFAHLQFHKESTYGRWSTFAAELVGWNGALLFHMRTRDQTYCTHFRNGSGCAMAKAGFLGGGSSVRVNMCTCRFHTRARSTARVFCVLCICCGFMS